LRFAATRILVIAQQSEIALACSAVMLLIGAFDAVMKLALFDGQQFHDMAGHGFPRVNDAQGQVNTLADAKARGHAGSFLLGCSGGEVGVSSIVVRTSWTISSSCLTSRAWVRTIWASVYRLASAAQGKLCLPLFRDS
jgi:hypothetical protein